MDIGKNTILVILLIAFVAIGAYVYTNTSKQTTIAVDGNSELSVAPDFVSVYITIETLNKSSQDSKTANAEITRNVMDALRSLNIKDSDIETVSYNIYEDYTWSESSRKSNGWKTTNQIKVKLTEYSFVGVVVDKAVDNGALISYINFELTPEHENALKAQAIENATRDAKTKAEAAARGAGGKLGKIVSITTSEYRYTPYNLYTAKSMDSSSNAEAIMATTQISPKNTDVYANVQVVYAIR